MWSNLHTGVQPLSGLPSQLDRQTARRPIGRTAVQPREDDKVKNLRINLYSQLYIRFRGDLYRQADKQLGSVLHRQLKNRLYSPLRGRIDDQLRSHLRSYSVTIARSNENESKILVDSTRNRV